MFSKTKRKLRNHIAKDSPVTGSTHETCSDWLKIYSNHIYRNSIFFKGPLLVLSSDLEENLSLGFNMALATHGTVEQ